MSKLPVVSGKETLKAFQKIGYQLDHQTGSHLIMRLAKPPHRRLTIPNHKELAKGTLRALIREAGLKRKRVFSTVVGPCFPRSKNPN